MKEDTSTENEYSSGQIDTESRSHSTQIGVLVESSTHGRLVINTITDLSGASITTFRVPNALAEFIETEPHPIAVVGKSTIPSLTSDLHRYIREGDIPVLLTAHQLTFDEAVAAIRWGVADMVLFSAVRERLQDKMQALIEDLDYAIQEPYGNRPGLKGGAGEQVDQLYS